MADISPLFNSLYLQLKVFTALEKVCRKYFYNNVLMIVKMWAKRSKMNTLGILFLSYQKYCSEQIQGDPIKNTIHLKNQA